MVHSVAVITPEPVQHRVDTSDKLCSLINQYPAIFRRCCCEVRVVADVGIAEPGFAYSESHPLPLIVFKRADDSNTGNGLWEK